MSGLEPVNIYDTFITGRDWKFKELARIIEKYGKQNIAAAEFLKKFEISGEPFAAAQKVYLDATRGDGNLFFNALDGTKIALYSPSTYEQGSSISHIAESPTVTENFLMIPRLSSGISIQRAMEITGSNTIYGKDLQRIMESIGWPTPKEPILKYLELSLNFDGTIRQISKGYGYYPLGILFTFMIFLIV